MRQHENERARGSWGQQAAVLEYVCRIRYLSPLVRCSVPLEICRTLGLGGSRHIQGVADALDLGHSQISKHLTKMTCLGVVQEHHSGRCTHCSLGDRCTCTRESGLLLLSMATPEDHRIEITGPDTQPDAPEWFGHLSHVASEILGSACRCHVLLCTLLQRERCVSEIAERCGQSLALASHHVQALRRAGIVDYTERRQRHLFHISTRCKANASRESLRLAIPCEGDSTLSLVLRLKGALPRENDASTGARKQVDTASQAREPEIHTKPRSGKFARDP